MPSNPHGMRQVKRPDFPRTRQQLLAHAAADGVQTIYPKAEVTIGIEQVGVYVPGEDYFTITVYRESEN